MRKRCSKCRIKKDIKEFNINRTMKDGHQCYCLKCDREHARQYYKKKKRKGERRFNPRELVGEDKYYFNLRELVHCYLTVFAKRAKAWRLTNYNRMMGSGKKRGK